MGGCKGSFSFFVTVKTSHLLDAVTTRNRLDSAAPCRSSETLMSKHIKAKQSSRLDAPRGRWEVTFFSSPFVRFHSVTMPRLPPWGKATSTYRADIREQDLPEALQAKSPLQWRCSVRLAEQQCTDCSQESVRVCVCVFPCLCVFRVLSSPGPVRLQDYLITPAN